MAPVFGFFVMSDDYDMSGSSESEGARGVNRRRFVKAMGTAGGVALTGGAFTSSVGATPSSAAEPEPVTGDDIGQLVSTVARKDDVVNLMGREWAEQVQNANVTEAPPDSHPVHDDHPRGDDHPARDGPPRHEVRTRDGALSVSAARHDLQGPGSQARDANEMTAVAFEVSDDQVLAFYEYDEVEDGVKSKAELWNIVDEDETDADLLLEESSYNGALARPISEVDQDEVSIQSDDPCGGCTGGPPGGDQGRELRSTCTSTSVIGCVVFGGGCAACAVACPFIGAAGCVTCVLANCPAAVVNCCGGFEDACVTCGTTL